MNCPKCGFEQPEATECARCGVIFAKLAPAQPEPAPRSGGSGGAGFGGGGRSGAGPAGQGGAGLAGHGGGEATGFGAAGGETVYGGPEPGSVAAQLPIAAMFRLRPVVDLTAGEIFQQTFSTYFANFGAFLMISLLGSLPSLLQVALREPRQGEVEEAAIYLLIMILLGFLNTGLTSAGMTYGVLQRLRGREISVGECVSQAFGAVFPVLAVVLLQALCLAFSAVACFIPFLFIWPMLLLAVPAAVEERPGALGALKRSAELTEGHRFAIIMGFLGIGMAVGLTSGIVLFGVRFLGGGGRVLTVLTSYLQVSLTNGFSATGAAYLYYRLRSAKEATHLKELASVFD